MPRWRRAAWIALAIVAALALAWWLYHRVPAERPAGRFGAGGPMPVVVAPVTQGNIDIVFNALGTVTPTATVTVRSQISGQLTQILFQEGQTVQKGDLLAVIDPRPYELALEQAQGQLLKDQALLKQAQTDLARYQILAKEDSIARQTVDGQVQLVRQYEGAIKTDQSQVDTANLNIAYCHVVAPVSGQVGLRQVDQGNYVTAGDANGIVVITQMKPITAIFSLPEDDLPAIVKRIDAGATLDVTAYDRTNTTKLATGKLVSIDNQIDTTTGTVKLRAQFSNEGGLLFPNQFINVRLLADVLSNATVIPSAAVQRGAPGTFVYVLKSDDTVSVQKIQTGPTDGANIAVEAGLTPGQKVVIDGADKLRDDAKVVLRQETTPAPAGAASAPAPAGASGAPSPAGAVDPPAQKQPRRRNAAP
ncbi:MAG TPA: MdtA/MuxA family multidrug efflux RND transporter periplasmic adaptor subunit [Stellaceae bacterium]|nr:MdtA/MuxA family multidrug efflux RND transporter periplasmic adaptor subunit [Stellaceae bacterium]